MRLRFLAALTALVAASACYEPIVPAERVWANAVTSLAGLHPHTADVMRFDTETSFDRNGSLVVTTTGENPSFLLYEIKGAELANSVMHYQARLKTKDLTGTASIEMRMRFPDKGTFPAFPKTPLEGTRDWVLQQASFWTDPGESPDRVYLMLKVEGTGTVWIDDLKLLRSPR